MPYIQIVFFLAAAGIGSLSWWMWLLYRRHHVPGTLWWTAGFVAIALTALAVISSVYWGEWLRLFPAHMLFIGGLGALWLGTRRFLGERVGLGQYLFLAAVLAVTGFAIYWYAFISPAYRNRLAIGCVVPLLFALTISQKLFAVRLEQQSVTAAGAFYSLFALINGLRTIDILLHSSVEDLLVSKAGGVLGTLLTFIILAAQVATICMIRDEGRAGSDPGD